MKVRITALVTVLSVLFSSLIFAQYPQMDFPLQIGNRWQYSEVPGHPSESRAVKDTLMPNGLTYTQVTGELFSGYFRTSESKVFIYDSSTNSESVYYDFTHKVGDTLSLYINDEDTVVSTVYEEGISLIFGQQRHYMSFLTISSTTSMYGIRTVTDGLGFTSYNGEVFIFGLSGAIINGIQYGVIVPTWADNISFSPDTLFLYNYSISDSCSIINNSDEVIYLDSIYSKTIAFFYCSIKRGNEYLNPYFRIFNYEVYSYEKSDSLNIRLIPNDTIKFIIVGVDPCPICKKQNTRYLKDTLVFAFSSDSNEIAEKLVLLNSNISSDVEDKAILDHSFNLSQNYPNPFNPMTKINYSIPERSIVSLKVYDLLGNEIEILINEEKESGNYQAEFNGSNYSSGVYFYRIQAGPFSDTKKFILLK